MGAEKNIAIVGAGPGGLAAAMLLSSKGYNVSVYEKSGKVGGRNASITGNGFTFDTGPTFLMMKFVLENLFAGVGRDINKYLTFVRLDPMYRLMFKDKNLFITPDTDRMKAEIEKYFPGESGGLNMFKRKEHTRFEHLYPCLESDYSSLGKLFSEKLFKALPYLSLGKSVYDELGTYFKSEELKLAFTFQAKYLGMSAWHCPALFTMLPFIEHEMGIFHVKGGLNKISDAMAKVIEENGGRIYLNTPVDKIIKHNGKAIGVKLASGENKPADAVIINADFASAMLNLFDPGELKKYNKEKIDSMRYSCSTFMMYLGLKKTYKDIAHHSIIFAKDYKKNVTEIFETKTISADISFYIQNASVSDETLAPQGKSAIYVLVPVPNMTSGIDWPFEKAAFRDLVLRTIEERTEFKDIRQNIEFEHITTPDIWQNEKDVYNGATFNLAHNIGQMLYFRPHNRFEECKNCYITGGGTHPGSGLPTIYESAVISAGLLEEDLR